MRERLISDEEQTLNPNPNPLPSSLVIYLYIGHFLARWGARMWEFSVGLYMIQVWPDSLFLAAAYGVVESASTALFGPLIGQLVDKLTYLKVLQFWLLAQNISFLVAGGTVVGVLIYPDLKSTNFKIFMLLIILINVSGAIGVLSTLAGTILIEREWVVVISEGHPPGVLTQMNSVIRRIDLICNLFAPVATGFIITFVSLKASAMALAFWNVTSVCLQYWLLFLVYNGIPALCEKRASRIVPLDVEDRTLTFSNNDSNFTRKRWIERVVEKVYDNSYVNSWRIYMRQDVVLPGVSLAILYFTILSFGTLMTAALTWEGIPAYILGLARGISAMIGIAATFVYPILQSRISTLRTGVWSIWSQWSFLLVCVASIFVKNNLISAYMLMGGVAASRLGLWMFDLSVIQQMQDHVPESDRCVVGGVQNSLQSVFDLMTYVTGLIISNPKDFWKLTILSFVLVSMAAILYCIHVYRVRKHLFHFEKLLNLLHWCISR